MPAFTHQFNVRTHTHHNHNHNHNHNRNHNSYTNPPVCPEGSHQTDTTYIQRANTNTTMYIFHPNSSFNISGQDLGDIVGDTFFTCVDVLTNQSSMVDHSYAWISEWNVEYAGTYGQVRFADGAFTMQRDCERYACEGLWGLLDAVTLNPSHVAFCVCSLHLISSNED